MHTFVHILAYSSIPSDIFGHNIWLMYKVSRKLRNIDSIGVRCSIVLIVSGSI